MTDKGHSRRRRSRTSSRLSGPAQQDRAVHVALDRAAASGELTPASVRRIVSDLATLSSLSPSRARGGVAAAMVASPAALHDAIGRRWANVSTRGNKISACVSSMKHCCMPAELGDVSAARAFWTRAMAASTGAIKAAAATGCGGVHGGVHGGAATRGEAALDDVPDPARLRAAIAKLDRAKDSSLAASQDHLWLTIALMVPPKRTEWGNVRIVEARGDARAGEHTLLAPRTDGSPLTLALWRRAGGARYEEVLVDAVSAAVRRSLAMFPRKHVFVDARGRPFLSGNSWAQWVKRAFRRTGVGDHSLRGLRRAWVRGLDAERGATDEARGELARRMLVGGGPFTRSHHRRHHHRANSSNRPPTTLMSTTVAPSAAPAH